MAVHSIALADRSRPATTFSVGRLVVLVLLVAVPMGPLAPILRPDSPMRGPALVLAAWAVPWYLALVLAVAGHGTGAGRSVVRALVLLPVFAALVVLVGCLGLMTLGFIGDALLPGAPSTDRAWPWAWLASLLLGYTLARHPPGPRATPGAPRLDSPGSPSHDGRAPAGATARGGPDAAPGGARGRTA